MATRPSHDNVINSLGVNMASALDQIMTIQEQSYDEFLDGFTYLNKDELKKEMVNPGRKKLEKPLTSKTKNNKNKGKEITKPLLEDKSKAILKENTDDELEEELLEDGEKTSIMSQKSPTGSDVTSKLKFDNFVMDCMENEEGDSDEPEEDFMSGGYLASFSAQDNKVSSSKACSEGNSKENKLPVSDEETEDIDNLLQDNSDKSRVLNIPSKSQNTDFPIKASDQGCVSIEKTNSLLDSNNPVSELDLQRECAQCSEQLSSEDRVGAPPSDSLLNPGEVEDPGSPSAIQMENKERILDFSATYRTEVLLTEESVEECSNEVTAFCLDEDFDYDNVVLTPKFTAEEMEFLKSCKT
ncbi:midasin-like [Saccostrea cucullata]|uniref:midasin-like n=1 Tax=Saccostrea cuccullata TaxID=36930 RepID=UPI002ED005EC